MRGRSIHGYAHFKRYLHPLNNNDKYSYKTDKMKGHGNNQPGTEAAIVVRARGRPEEPYIFTYRVMVLCQGGHFNISVAR